MRRMELLGGLAVSLMLLASPGSAQQQDKAYAFDETGKGAVLCLYEIYQGIQQYVRMCGWERTDSDVALDRGVAAMEDFIRKNSTIPSTLEWMERVKQRNIEAAGRATAEEISQRCSDDLTTINYSFRMTNDLRSRSATEIDAHFDDMLSIPREPVMNPCL